MLKIIYFLDFRPKIVEMEFPVKYFLARMKNSSAKLALFRDVDLTDTIYNDNEALIKLEEVLMTTQNGFIYHRNHFMLHLTDKVIGPLIPSGILQQLQVYHKYFIKLKNTPEEHGPQVLRVTDLSFGFVLWLFACGTSTTVFIVEWLIPRVKRLIRTTIGLVLFLRLLRQRLNVVY
jgi:hypothetical protein